MKLIGYELVEKPCIYTSNHIINKLSTSFLHLIGYEETDVLGKTLIEVNCLLKSEQQLSLQDVTDTRFVYIFTSANVPVEVKISTEILDNEKIYYFERQENHTLDFTLHNFANVNTRKNESQAIFSYPECILLKHDENYLHTLSLIDPITEHPLGKKPTFSNNILDLFKQETSLHEFGVESLNSDGLTTYWDINLNMIRGNKDNQFIVCSFYDVTEKVHDIKAITKQRNEMRLVLDDVENVVNILDKDGNYTYINKAGMEFIRPFIPKYIPDFKSVNINLLYKALATNENHKAAFDDIPAVRVLKGETFKGHTIAGASGVQATYYVCDATPIYDEQGNIDGAAVVYKNLESTYESEEYKTLQENVSYVSFYYVTYLPSDFTINYINDYAFKFFKRECSTIHTELDVIGKNFFTLYNAEDTELLIKNINESIANHSSYTHKHNFSKDGRTTYTKIIFQPVFDKSNRVEKIIVLGIDITDEEKATIQMEKLLTAQDELFINTSHELNTPLSVIFSGAQLLNLYLEKESLEDVKDKILNINATTIVNCHRLMKLINNILDISKIESGLYELNLCNYNIVAIIDDIVASVSEFTKLKDIQIIFDTEVEELIIALDGYKFDRIMLNLISNAIKFSVTGKIILIKLVIIDDQTLSISVKDEGIGIDQQNIDAIFSKYIQVNRELNRISEGTGLGLPLARSMAELHGGSLHVESTLNKGSTFTVELPMKIVDTVSTNQDIDRTEIIKQEFSDIYL